MVEAISGGDESFVRRMVQLFIDTMPPSLEELQRETHAANWDSVSKLAHKMKATVDSMGIASLQETVRTIEHNGKKGEHAEVIPALVAQFVSVIQDCIAQLKEDFG
jgi:HPt (histidine-containing phosphotransfer) domain-containing protein